MKLHLTVDLLVQAHKRKPLSGGLAVCPPSSRSPGPPLPISSPSTSAGPSRSAPVPMPSAAAFDETRSGGKYDEKDYGPSTVYGRGASPSSQYTGGHGYGSMAYPAQLQSSSVHSMRAASPRQGQQFLAQHSPAYPIHSHQQAYGAHSWGPSSGDVPIGFRGFDSTKGV